MNFIVIGRRAMFLGLASATLFCAAPPIFGQQTDENVRLRGVIDKLEGQSMTLKTADGNSSELQIAADVLVTRNEPSTLAAVKAGDFIASAAVKGDDGKLHSTELRIFPPALRGLGEGQRPMQEPGKTMTNAAVSEVVGATDGQLLKVKFGDSTSELVVGPTVPITAVVIARVTDLKAGQAVFVTAARSTDGKLTATRIFAQ